MCKKRVRWSGLTDEQVRWVQTLDRYRYSPAIVAQNSMRHDWFAAWEDLKKRGAGEAPYGTVEAPGTLVFSVYNVPQENALPVYLAVFNERHPGSGLTVTEELVMGR